MSTPLFLEYEDVVQRPENRLATGMSETDVAEFLAAFASAAEGVEVMNTRGGPAIPATDSRQEDKGRKPSKHRCVTPAWQSSVAAAPARRHGVLSEGSEIWHRPQEGGRGEVGCVVLRVALPVNGRWRDSFVQCVRRIT